MKKKVAYIEPEDYFPKKICKKYGIGKYKEPDNEQKKEEYLEFCGGMNYIIQPPIFDEEKKV